MKRRDFIKFVAGSTAIWSFAARAQQSDHVRRVGILMGYPEHEQEGQAYVASFRDGLRHLGWIDVLTSANTRHSDPLCLRF